jgi:Trypsin-like peptidase domain
VWIRSLNKSWLIGVGVVALIILAFVFHPKGDGSNQNNQQSVVDVLCDTGYGGSGTIFTADGTVLTNNHVIAGAKLCEVTIPDPATGGISKIYEAAPVIVSTLSEKYDVATLKIDGSYTDKNGKTWGTYPTTFQSFVLPSKCDPTSPSKLGDSVRIYGYPVTSGGYNLTITDGVISSFADDGNILTSAQIDSGNSGGLAIDQNGCWLGIPSAVVSGKYQNLGVIIPGDIVEKYFLNTVPAKLNPAAANENSKTSIESATASQETNDQQCQDGYGVHSEWSGRTSSAGKLLCGCQAGYSWSGDGNSCASQTVLNQWCVNNYGLGSYSTPQDGKGVCDCSTGYTLNSDGTACVVVQKNYSQQCQDIYGTYSDWSGKMDSSGKPTCQCQTGYSWDGSGNACATQTSLQQACQTTYGSGSYSHTQNGKAVCDCSTGYAWDSGQTMCI